MAITTTEVIKANLVLVGLRLLSGQEEFEAFRRAVGSDVQAAGTGLAMNIRTGLTEPMIGLALNRDRITIELSPDRSTINRDYPLREDLRRLAEVAGYAIDNTPEEEQQLQAFGFNMDMIFDQDSEELAFEYLSRRLFNAGPLGNEGWQLVGGAGKLIFDDGDRRWTISLEPRFNDATESRVLLTANLHRPEQRLPTEDEIRNSLEGLWDETHLFVQRLDERGS